MLMVQLTVEETIATLILLENVIENLDDDMVIRALELLHDDIDYQMLSSFGLAGEEVIGQEVFEYLNKNSKVKVKLDIDDLSVQMLRAIYSPLLQQEDLTTKQRMQAAKILFKLS